MLRSIKDMEGSTIGATDGIIGLVKDFYFDDEAWVIRYLVVDAGEGHVRRKVLISPISIGQPNWSERIFPISLRRRGCVPPRPGHPSALRCRRPDESISSTGALSHSLIRCSILASLTRRTTDFISGVCGIVSKYRDRSASITCE